MASLGSGWVVSLGFLFYESSGSHSLQLSSSLLILSTWVSVSVAYFITLGCEGEEVNKILIRIPVRESLDFGRNTWMSCRKMA